MFAQWVGSRWFAPNALKATVREADGVKGIYLPWWTYDADTVTTYRGERGVQRRVQENRPNATAQAGAATTRVVTDWSPASGAVPVGFDDILIAGSPSIAPHLARVLDQWDLSRLRPPADEVLAGFGVEVYRTGLEDGFVQARAAHGVGDRRARSGATSAATCSASMPSRRSSMTSASSTC